LPTKKYKREFEFVEVIMRNIVSFFHLGYNKENKDSIFDDAIITSTVNVESKFYTLLVKCTFRIMCAQNCKIAFKFVQVIQGKL